LINPDLLKTRNRERTILKACLQSGQKFVIDNTNPTLEDRKRYIVPAKAANFEVVGYFFESEIKEALERNRKRPEDQRISDRGILATYRKLRPPSYDEGFDKLYRVKIDAQGLFKVEEWSDEVR
jgi:predicted kinase